MTYKTIAVHTEAGAANRVKLALDLARRHDATLIGVAAGMWRPPVALIGPDLGGFSADIIESGREQVEVELKSAAGEFRRLTECKDVKTEWRSVADFPHTALCDAANAADLIVLGPLEPYTVGAEYRSANLGDVLIGAGRPLLVVPEGVSQLKAQNIVVAWKNTREARRAIADALPFMVQASSVVLVQVRERGEESETISDAKAFLARHGVNVRSEIRDLKASTVEDELVQYARGIDADLIVAGAYGRSRLREWVFGGVTRGLAAQRSIVCLLSH